jgi:hypothetical protein
MDKTDIASIKKMLRVDRSATIDKVWACYVTPDKDKIVIPIQPFAMLDEQDTSKYITIFKKTLTGTVGKQLSILPFPLRNGLSPVQTQLMELRTDKLQNLDKLHDVFDAIVNAYSYTDYYCILLAHVGYDGINGRREPVDYDYLLCDICPVTLSKPNLAYIPVENKIESLVQNFLISPPALGFMYPTYEDGQANINETIVYSKKNDGLDDGFIENFFGCVPGYSPESQRMRFAAVMESAFDDEQSVEDTLSVLSSVRSALEEHSTSKSGEPAVMDEKGLEQIMEINGASNLPSFHEAYQKYLSEGDLFLEALVDSKVSIVGNGYSLTVEGDTSNFVTVREIDGKKYLTIPLGAVEINGIHANR